MQKFQHLVSIKDITKEQIDAILDKALQIENDPKAFANSCEGKILANIFFEPSTRTRLSFESAMLRLGGKVLGFADPATSSVKKGESIADTIRMAAAYSDIIVMRHFLEGSGRVASEYSSVPVISGGTGIQEHPTQALLDIYTIKKEFNKIDGLTIGLLGDLRFGRTIPSLLYAFSKYKDIKIKLYSPPQLKARMTVLTDIEGKLSYQVEESLSDTIDTLDVLYVTRVQKERFPDEATYERVKGSYIINTDLIKKAKQNMIIMHPLPRVGEIDYKVDQLPQARYFQQAKNGVWVRMALLYMMLGD
ncbi:MAG: aspartate carbamoyltransferase [Candidatus Heimdallarchaeota archaeon]|nr:aspartate carbamoyltransferase [Candidatus Heimdallarchaeota archaeon]MDH5646495.1 aspartate carbamoyltransferase [Candidatus Heimdallarchaeota archaeon]